MFRKIGDEVVLVYNPRAEGVEVGENIKILDENHSRGLIVQVIEQSLIDLSGILEDIIRAESIGEVEVEEHTPPEYEKYRLDVRNMKFARAKIRKEIKIRRDEESVIDWTGWVPDRSAHVESLDDDWLMKKLGIQKELFKHPIALGETTYAQKQLIISAYHMQGITVIVGKKGTGKSHIAKALLLGLIDNKGKGIVFDINDEYATMRFNEDGTESPYHNKILALDPGDNLRFTLSYIGSDVFFDVIQTTMGLNDPSTFELRNLWEQLESQENLTFSNLREIVGTSLDRRIRGAVTRRLDRMEQTNLFADDPSEATTLESEFQKIEKGGALVINLKMKSKDTIDLVVQTVLRKTEELLESGHHPLFIFAEEAHTYLRETNWADAVTRMRHLGTYQIYMTNTPTQIRPLVIRQTDNLILFHLTEPRDFQHVSAAARIDPETVEQVAKALPPRTCLVIGEATKHYPFVIKTVPLQVRTAGETRLYFKEP